ncbi:MAG: D-alanine--D-alanine ligase family protein [Acidimicrobiia bacterium]
MPSRIKLIVLFGGRSAEHDVSRVTASHVLRAVDPARYDVVPVAIGRDGSWHLADEALAALADGPDALPDALHVGGPDIDPLPVLRSGADGAQPTTPAPVVALPLLHGPFGEDGTVQGLLELAGVPYVGAGVLASSLAMDKAKAREVFAYAGIPQARWLSWRADEVPADPASVVGDELGFPCFVKPANLGSSVGVSKVHDAGELRAALELALSYDEWVVVEEAIVGREIELAVLGNERPEVSVPGEIIPGAEFYDYEDKYHDGRAKLLIPAPLPDGVAERFRQLAVAAFRACRAEGMARVDFFHEEDGPARGPLLNEVNTIPGFTPISMYPKLWQASGLGYPQLIDRLIELALDRHRRRADRTRTDR